jgi:hypothetical protein
MVASFQEEGGVKKFPVQCRAGRTLDQSDPESPLFEPGDAKEQKNAVSRGGRGGANVFF